MCTECELKMSNLWWFLLLSTTNLCHGLGPRRQDPQGKPYNRHTTKYIIMGNQMWTPAGTSLHQIYLRPEISACRNKHHPVRNWFVHGWKGSSFWLKCFFFFNTTIWVFTHLIEVKCFPLREDNLQNLWQHHSESLKQCQVC